jgi:hypothetical protein
MLGVDVLQVRELDLAFVDEDEGVDLFVRYRPGRQSLQNR